MGASVIDADGERHGAWILYILKNISGTSWNIHLTTVTWLTAAVNYFVAEAVEVNNAAGRGLYTKRLHTDSVTEMVGV